MRNIFGGVLLSPDEKRALAKQLVDGLIAQQKVRIYEADNDVITKMAGAMERACSLSIDALQKHVDEIPEFASVLEQMHAELVNCGVRF